MTVMDHSHTLRPKKVATYQNGNEVVVTVRWSCVWVGCDHYLKSSTKITAPEPEFHKRRRFR